MKSKFKLIIICFFFLNSCGVKVPFNKKKNINGVVENIQVLKEWIEKDVNSKYVDEAIANDYRLLLNLTEAQLNCIKNKKRYE
ncbi:MAG: hypothetical protein CL846_06625 [Crocinitomicaceae bacterium]|nr:hypothetical protein [Crocinitomicaceae bacterium]|tara:strand:- start:1613 stop:1861 length:249 start_codon:yes stop_codon:yes gene_type:complete